MCVCVRELVSSRIKLRVVSEPFLKVWPNEIIKVWKKSSERMRTSIIHSFALTWGIAVT